MPTTPWKNIRDGKMTAAQRARARRAAEKTLVEIELRELREALKVTQAEMARRLKVTQVAISRLERRPNQVKTIAAYLKALGARLEIRAILPDREVELTHLAIK